MSLIDALAGPITVTRRAPGAYVNHRWVEPDPEVLAKRAAVQPAKPTEVVHLPEGQRTRGAIKLYSDFELYAADVAARRRPDVVTYRGRDYEVAESGIYEGFGLAAWKAIATLLEDEPDEDVEP
ncbi:hypothetical protein D3C72_1506570 [compost metagenome]